MRLGIWRYISGRYEQRGTLGIFNQTRQFAVRVRPRARRAAPVSRQPPPPVSSPQTFPSAPSFFDSPPPTQNFDHSTPVKFPPRKLTDILSEKSSAGSVLSNALLIVNRQVEMLNVFLGYEQVNQYAIQTSTGHKAGFIAENPGSFFTAIARQMLRTRRQFSADILDSNGNVVLKIERPIKWFLNSHISVYSPEGRLLGEVRQTWHLWRRQYDLFRNKQQFARIDEGFLAVHFRLQDANGGTIGAIDRNFVGFARELFTDTGQYAIHMDSVQNASRSLSLDERAVLLACAMNIDIDYFSWHSRSGIPLPFFLGGGTWGGDGE